MCNSHRVNEFAPTAATTHTDTGALVVRLENNLGNKDCDTYEPTYRKGVDVVVVLNVKESHRAP